MANFGLVLRAPGRKAHPKVWEPTSIGRKQIRSNSRKKLE